MAIQTTALALGSLALLIVVQRWVEFRQLLASVGDHPGLRTLFGRPIPVLLRRRIPYLTAGTNQFVYKHDDHAHFGWDVTLEAKLLPSPRVSYQVADAEVIKELTTSRARFPKPVAQYKVLGMFGSNLIMTEGDEWKRQRKFVSPVFSERNNRLVWDETVKIMRDLFEVKWAGQDTIVVDDCVEDLTLPIALFVLSAAAFGKPVSWLEGSQVPAGHSMAFKDALHLLSVNLLYKIVPRWLRFFGLGAKIAQLQVASDEFERYMAEMISLRRSGADKVARYDILSGLIAANEETAPGEPNLSDSELTGNVFILMVAGHETTAHTLAFTFGLLALYPEVQEELFRQVHAVLPDGRLPEYSDMSALKYPLAVIYETLRLFPPVPVVPKVSAEDTALTTTNAAGERRTFPVPKGTILDVRISALHYNPRYWPEPYEFKPERFLEAEWPRDAFAPFSAGARACIGRKFTETEAVAMLTMIATRYRVAIKDEPEFAGESWAARRARVLDAKIFLTLAPKRMPLVFTRR